MFFTCDELKFYDFIYSPRVIVVVVWLFEIKAFVVFNCKVYRLFCTNVYILLYLLQNYSGNHSLPGNFFLGLAIFSVM